MKKVTALFIMNLVLATSLYSQVKFLPKIGVSWSSVSFDENINERFEGKVKFGEEPDNYAGSNYYVNPFDFGLQYRLDRQARSEHQCQPVSSIDRWISNRWQEITKVPQNKLTVSCKL